MALAIIPDANLWWTAGPRHAEQPCRLLNFCELNQCREGVRWDGGPGPGWHWTCVPSASSAWVARIIAFHELVQHSGFWRFCKVLRHHWSAGLAVSSVLRIFFFCPGGTACHMSTSGLIIVFLKFYFFWRQGLCSPWNSLCRSLWPWTQRSSCFCILSAGIKGVHHHRLAHIILNVLLRTVMRPGEGFSS